jgi:hypothetical protein
MCDSLQVRLVQQDQPTHACSTMQKSNRKLYLIGGKFVLQILDLREDCGATADELDGLSLDRKRHVVVWRTSSADVKFWSVCCG